MRNTLLLSVFLVFAAVAPIAAQTPDPIFSVNVGIASPNFFGASGDTERGGGNMLNLGFGVLLVRNFVTEVTWTGPFGNTGPAGHSMSTTLVGGRFIHPITGAVSLYHGPSFGRYSKKHIRSDNTETGDAFRYKSGVMWGLAPRIRLGFEVRWDHYGGDERSELGGGTGITFAF